MLLLTARQNGSSEEFLCNVPLRRFYTQTNQFLNEVSEFEVKIEALDPSVYVKFNKHEYVDVVITHDKYRVGEFTLTDTFTFSKLLLNACREDEHGFTLSYFQFDTYSHLVNLNSSQTGSVFCSEIACYRQAEGSNFIVEDGFIVDGVFPDNLYGAANATILIRNTFFNLTASIECENIRPEPRGFAFFSNTINSFTYDDYRDERGLPPLYEENFQNWSVEEGF